MGTLVLIRHARKLYGNKDGCIPRYDPAIIDSEWERAPDILGEYIETHSIKPTRIISSPYLRTRETSQILSDITSVPIEINRLVSEFLGWNKDFSEDNFHPCTFKHDPIPPEKKNDYTTRINNALGSILEETKKDEVVWVVTHGYGVRTFLLSKNFKLNSVKPLTGAIIKQGDIKPLK